MHTQLIGKFFVFNKTIYNSAINYFLHSLNLLQEKKSYLVHYFLHASKKVSLTDLKLIFNIYSDHTIFLLPPESNTLNNK